MARFSQLSLGNLRSLPFEARITGGTPHSSSIYVCLDTQMLVLTLAEQVLSHRVLPPASVVLEVRFTYIWLLT
jgi:hypothetical protein